MAVAPSAAKPKTPLISQVIALCTTGGQGQSWFAFVKAFTNRCATPLSAPRLLPLICLEFLLLSPQTGVRPLPRCQTLIIILLSSPDLSLQGRSVSQDAGRISRAHSKLASP